MKKEETMLLYARNETIHRRFSMSEEKTLSYSFQAEVPVIAECDVLIVGGGPGGFGAGVMAAKQ